MLLAESKPMVFFPVIRRKRKPSKEHANELPSASCEGEGQPADQFQSRANKRTAHDAEGDSAGNEAGNGKASAGVLHLANTTPTSAMPGLMQPNETDAANRHWLHGVVKCVRDKRAIDGGLAEAERIIRKGGRIKYAGIWWQHEKLKEHEGATVLVCSDYWRQELDVMNLPTLDRNERFLTVKALNVRTANAARLNAIQFKCSKASQIKCSKASQIKKEKHTLKAGCARECHGYMDHAGG